MIDRNRLQATFLDLVRIPSPSGQEAALAAYVSGQLSALGIEARCDGAGNLYAFTDGVGDPLLLNAHMDTVVPCERVTPVVADGVIASDGTSVLGADDKAGVAVILEVLRVLREERLARRPVDVLLTVREEVGLEGVKAADLSRLRAVMGIGLDASGEPGIVVVSAPSQDSLYAEVHGRAAHAGVNPQDGINAIRVAAEAIVAMPLGRLDYETTANIGVIAGGQATNIIPELATLKGEARSHSPAKLESQTRAMVQALQHAAAGAGATVDVRVTRRYEAYCFDERTPVVGLVSSAMRSLGYEPRLVPTGGGSDANVLNAAGLQVVNISVGMQAVHTCDEHIALDDMLPAVRTLIECLTH